MCAAVALVVVHVVLVLPFARAVGHGTAARISTTSAAAAEQRARQQQNVHAARAFFQALAIVVAVVHITFTFRALVFLVKGDGGSHGQREGTEALGIQLYGVVDMGVGLVMASARNVCQASISIDAVMASVAGGAFMLGSAEGADDWTQARRACVLSAMVGPAAGLALFYARPGGPLSPDFKEHE